MAGGRETVEFVLRVQAAEAKRAIDGVAESAGKASTAAKGAQAQVSTLDKSMKDASGTAGRAKESMEGLAAALSLVSPEAAGLVRGVSAATAGIKGLMAVGGSLITVLGPVTVAVAAFGAAWTMASNELERANKKIEESAKRAADQQDRISRSKASVERLTLEARVAAGEAPESDLQAMIAREQAASAVEGQRSVQFDLRSAALGEIGSLQERQRVLEGFVARQEKQGQTGTKEMAELADVRAAIIQAEGRVKSAEGTIKQIDKNAEELGRAIFEGMRKGAEEQGNKPEPTPKGGAGGPKPLTEADWGAWANSALETDLAFAAMRGGVTVPAGVASSGSAYGTSAAALSAALNSSINAEAVPAAAAASRFDSRQLLGAGAGLLQGDVGGLLGMAGPIGMGVGTLANVGRMGAGGVRDQLEGFTDAIVAGLEALPEILTEVIPDFIEGLITDLLPALVETFPLLAKAIAIDLPIALAKALWDVIKFLVPGGDAETGFFGKAANTVLDVFTLGQAARSDVGFGRGARINDGTGRRMTGGRGGDIRPDGTSASRTAGGAQIVVQGSVYGSLDTLTRDLDSHLGYGGRGRSAVLGR